MSIDKVSFKLGKFNRHCEEFALGERRGNLEDLYRLLRPPEADSQLRYQPEPSRTNNNGVRRLDLLARQFCVPVIDQPAAAVAFLPPHTHFSHIPFGRPHTEPAGQTGKGVPPAGVFSTNPVTE